MRKKFYADEDPIWLDEVGIMGYVFLPRWWNPLFWLYLIFSPITTSVYAAYTDKDDRGKLYLFFSALSSYFDDVSDFFARYRI